MPGISRRRFLRDASLGAAAAGALAVVGPSAFGVSATSAGASPLGAGTAAHDLSASSASSASSRGEVIAHVVDDSSGTISLYAGTQKFTLTDRALAEALLRSAR